MPFSIFKSFEHSEELVIHSQLVMCWRVQCVDAIRYFESACMVTLSGGHKSISIRRSELFLQVLMEWFVVHVVRHAYSPSLLKTFYSSQTRSIYSLFSFAAFNVYPL